MTTTKTQLFGSMLRSPNLEYLLEAHNGLSAKIVEEAGFAGIWASGLAISAALGVRDSNEASWTQVLEVAEFISDATSIPLMLDADTGFGNFNNVRRLVQKLEQRGVPAMCIEDKIFPKTNSFIRSEGQPLAEIDEFAGKIRAAKDSQTDPDFSVVARVESFIAGWGLDETLRRAEAYADAGADAVLIHSKRKDADEIESFMGRWDGRAPVVVVPTTYWTTPTADLGEMGVSLAIFANHLVRASVSAMQQAARTIRQDLGTGQLEDRIAPVAEIFRLQRADELAEAELRYLP